MNPITTRLLAGLVTALIAPRLPPSLKLTDGDTEALIALAPLAWHVIAAAWQKIVAAFVLYFPPPHPQTPVDPAKG
jgi:hypothetical protein